MRSEWQPYANAGDAYKGINEPAKAKDEYLKALDRNPNWVIQYTELIDFFSSINDEKNLEKTFLKAIRKFPRSPEILLKYTKHLIEKQRLEQAVNYLSLAYLESPNNPEIWDIYIKFAGPKDKAIEEEIKKKIN